MSVVKEALVMEIQDRMKLSVKYKQQLIESKTNTKKKYITTKLYKNNRVVAALMESLEQINIDRGRVNA